ncbi:Glycosyltransferase [Minicystis rosea]|nr:Glycosyltransferase [Minicystis rosea]
MNPILRKAEELARRGYEVALASTKEARSYVEGYSRGVRFLELGSMGSLQAVIKETEREGAANPDFGKGSSKMTENLIALWPIMYDGLCAAVAKRRPDVMVVNLAAFAGMDVAEREGIPIVIDNPYLLGTLPDTILPPADDLPFLLSGKSIRDVGFGYRVAGPLRRLAAGAALSLTVGRRINRLRKARGLPLVELSAFLKNKLILTNSAFGIEYSRPIPPLLHMVGPMIPELTPLPDDLRAWVEGGPPVVYANLGTLALASREQLARMLGAFRSDAFRVLWVLKDELKALLPEARPANVRIERWIPSPFSLLSHENVRVFVSHCGIPSAHESLCAGTPIVGIPMLGGQRDMAMRVVDAGVGLMIDKTRFTETELSRAILRVLHDGAFRRPIPAIQSSFQLAGGARRAADVIEHFIAVGTAHYTRSFHGG